MPETGFRAGVAQHGVYGEFRRIHLQRLAESAAVTENLAGKTFRQQERVGVLAESAGIAFGKFVVECFEPVGAHIAVVFLFKVLGAAPQQGLVSVRRHHLSRDRQPGHFGAQFRNPQGRAAPVPGLGIVDAQVGLDAPQVFGTAVVAVEAQFALYPQSDQYGCGHADSQPGKV